MHIIVLWVIFIFKCREAPERRDPVDNVHRSLKHKLKKYICILSNLSHNLKSNVDLKPYLEISNSTSKYPFYHLFHYLWKGLRLFLSKQQYKIQRIKCFWWIKMGAGGEKAPCCAGSPSGSWHPTALHVLTAFPARAVLLYQAVLLAMPRREAME